MRAGRGQWSESNYTMYTSVAFVCAGHRLGRELDEGAVRALGLPTFDQSEPTPNPSGALPPRVSEQEQPEKRRGKEMKPPSHPFIISSALPVVPVKLVKKIWSGEYVDMAELLRDNMEVERRRHATEGEGGSGAGTSSRREIPDLLSWLHCFSLYAAVVCERYPNKARELWAYQALIVSEHRRCGGRGWLLYDSAFRQQVRSLEDTDFSQVNQALYSTTFLAYGGKGQFCSRCLASNHAQEDCALYPPSAVPAGRFREQARSNRREDRHHHEPRRSWKGPCYAWNDGKCGAPYCRFEHVCSRCGGEHRRRFCKSGMPDRAREK